MCFGLIEPAQPQSMTRPRTRLMLAAEMNISKNPVATNDASDAKMPASSINAITTSTEGKVVPTSDESTLGPIW